MLEPEEVRPARALEWRLLAGVAWGATALILADVVRWMWIGPVPLLLLGPLLPPGADLEAEVGLGALAATGALVAVGGIRRRFGPAAVVTGLTLATLLSNLGPFPTGDTAPATFLPFALLRDGRLTFEG